MSSPFAKSSVVLICLIGLTGCAHNAGKPPSKSKATEVWLSSKYGFIHATYYFTKAQVKDARWESQRLEAMRGVRFCKGGSSVIRRDVRWVPATPVSGQTCGVVIYTVKCDTPTNAQRDGFEQDRREFLLGELDRLPRKQCTGVSRTGQVFPDSPAAEEKRNQLNIVDGPACDMDAPKLDGVIRITPKTRIAVTTNWERAFSKKFAGQDDDRLGRAVEGKIRSGLFLAGMLEGIFPATGLVSDEPDNIRVGLSLGFNRGGRLYCVQLTARQAGRVWRRTIERDDKTSADSEGLFSGFDPSNAHPDPTPGDDAESLSSEFRAALGLPDPETKPNQP